MIRANIGKNTIIMPNVFLGNNVIVGDNCIIHPNVLFMIIALLEIMLKYIQELLLAAMHFILTQKKTGRYGIKKCKVAAVLLLKIMLK